MSIVNMNFESQYLVNNNDVTIILPDKPSGVDPVEYYSSGKKYKVLWLLHGTFGDHSDWTRRTNIELYACERDLIVVMPSALNSNYSNWPTFMMGFNMYDYLTKELMPLIWNWYPASSKREDNYIAGLSMGGRGTVKIAAWAPELFAGAAVLSAAPQEYDLITEEQLAAGTNPMGARLKGMIDNAGGLQAFKDGPENAWRNLDLNKDKLPKLIFCCGEDDKGIYNNLMIFKKHAEETGIDAAFWTLPGYRHEWRFWDKAIEHALDFFGIEKTGLSKF